MLIRGLRLAGTSDEQILIHDTFKILGIAPGEIADALTELNRHGDLSFRQQADVIELKL